MCRILALTFLVIFGVAGCKRQAASDQTATTRPTAMSVQLDWIAEPEHGGLYQAQARGFFRDEGLDVTLIPGGPNAAATQKAAIGDVQVAQADSTNSILAIAEGLPVVQFAAVFQNDPSVLMLHEESPVRGFEDLKGRTIMARLEWAFLPYLKKKYGIDFSVVPQSFSIANFLADPDFIQQGYFIAEPFHIREAGGKEPRYLFAWDAGFDSYTVLVANRRWAAEHPDAMKAFVRAMIRGWKDYLEGDPAPANEAMKRANPQNSDAFLAFSRQQIIEAKLVTGRNAKDETGRISRARFAVQIQQLRDLGILKKAMGPEEVMTEDYLP